MSCLLYTSFGGGLGGVSGGFFGLEAAELVEGVVVVAVSYTHLDVYKRQINP